MTDRSQLPSSRDWRVTVLLVSVYVLAIAFAAVALLPEWWLAWAVVVVLGLALLVGWHARRFAYECRRCGAEFTIPALVDLVSPQGIDRGQDGAIRGWKLLRCPACHAWSRATVVRPTVGQHADRARA